MVSSRTFGLAALIGMTLGVLGTVTTWAAEPAKPAPEAKPAAEAKPAPAAAAPAKAEPTPAVKPAVEAKPLPKPPVPAKAEPAPVAKPLPKPPVPAKAEPAPVAKPLPKPPVPAAAQPAPAAKPAAPAEAAAEAPAGSCCPQPVGCCPQPRCIKYVQHHLRRKLCCCGVAPTSMVLVVKDPRCCAAQCTVEVPVCLPGCCTGEPQVDCCRGPLGRGYVTFKWCCGYEVRVVFLLTGDLLVHTWGS